MLRAIPLAFAIFLLVSPLAHAESTITCPPGKIDTLDWLTLDSDLRSSKHLEGDLPLWTYMAPDKFYWLKTPQGDTWDIFLYDSQYVYLWITEDSWNHPYNYKRNAYNTNFPAVPRCVTAGLPGNAIPISNTAYRTAIQCVEGSNHYLGTAVMEWWGPYTAGQPGQEANRRPVGGDIPNATPVYTLAYRWDCNSSYWNCSAKEEYIVAQRYGLVQYNFWSLVNGVYVLQSSVNFNHLVSGAITPFFPCF